MMDYGRELGLEEVGRQALLVVVLVVVVHAVAAAGVVVERESLATVDEAVEANAVSVVSVVHGGCSRALAAALALAGVEVAASAESVALLAVLAETT